MKRNFFLFHNIITLLFSMKECVHSSVSDVNQRRRKVHPAFAGQSQLCSAKLKWSPGGHGFKTVGIFFMETFPQFLKLFVFSYHSIHGCMLYKYRMMVLEGTAHLHWLDQQIDNLCLRLVGSKSERLPGQQQQRKRIAWTSRSERRNVTVMFRRFPNAFIKLFSNRIVIKNVVAGF